jgi:hypothetical protein
MIDLLALESRVCIEFNQLNLVINTKAMDKAARTIEVGRLVVDK